MLAVKAHYENGKITLKEKPPMDSADVIIVFPTSDVIDKVERFSDEEVNTLFEKFTGSVDRVIDYKTERMEALDEKYADSY